jgi:cell wall-associated NlpC family hydrolase
VLLRQPRVFNLKNEIFQNLGGSFPVQREGTDSLSKTEKDYSSSYSDDGMAQERSEKDGENMPNLVIRFVATRTPSGASVRFASMSVYEHVEALSRDCSGWTGAHAITGIEKRPLDWDKHVIRDDRYSLPVTQSQFDAFHDALESKIGVKYNYWLIVGIALHWRWLALLSKGREDCSQLIIWCLQKAGINPLNTLASYDALITPETLHLSPLFIGRRTKTTGTI